MRQSDSSPRYYRGLCRRVLADSKLIRWLLNVERAILNVTYTASLLLGIESSPLLQSIFLVISVSCYVLNVKETRRREHEMRSVGWKAFETVGSARILDFLFSRSGSYKRCQYTDANVAKSSAYRTCLLVLVNNCAPLPHAKMPVSA